MTVHKVLEAAVSAPRRAFDQRRVFVAQEIPIDRGDVAGETGCAREFAEEQPEAGGGEIGHAGVSPAARTAGSRRLWMRTAGQTLRAMSQRWRWWLR